MKLAMDHEEGELFCWHREIYKVVKPVKDSGEKLKVLRVATLINGHWYQVASVVPHVENFNTMCEVQSGKLTLEWLPE